MSFSTYPVSCAKGRRNRTSKLSSQPSSIPRHTGSQLSSPLDVLDIHECMDVGQTSIEWQMCSTIHFDVFAFLYEILG